MYHPIFLFLNIGTPEMILILFVALMLFGGEKLPQLAKGLGKGIRDFKDASEGVKRELHNQINNFEEKNTEPVAPVADQNLPVVAGTTALLDPFAVPAVEDHAADVEETHEGALATINQHNDLTHVVENHEGGLAPVNQHNDISHVGEIHESTLSANNQHSNIAEAGESHADLSHLITAHTEVTPVSENHISLSHVSDEHKAEEKNS